MQVSTKSKIRHTVSAYERVFADEFAQYKASIPQRDDMRKDKFGELKNHDYVLRRLVEWPETLYQLVRTTLTTDEQKELFDDPKGLEWFAKEFPVYRYAEKV